MCILGERADWPPLLKLNPIDAFELTSYVFLSAGVEIQEKLKAMLT